MLYIYTLNRRLKRLSEKTFYFFLRKGPYGFGAAQATNNSNPVYFEAKFADILTELLEYDAKDWFAIRETRASLTIALTTDILMSGLEGMLDLSGSSTYIGKSGIFIDLWGTWENEDKKEKQDILIVYEPVTGDAVYSLSDSSLDILKEETMDAVCSDGWYKIDLEDLKDANELLDGFLARVLEN